MLQDQRNSDVARPSGAMWENRNYQHKSHLGRALQSHKGRSQVGRSRQSILHSFQSPIEAFQVELVLVAPDEVQVFGREKRVPSLDLLRPPACIRM